MRTEEEEKLAVAAIAYVQKNWRELVQKFADDSIYLPVANQISVFMAGSPGAGKTEFSKRFISAFGEKVVRIDADEIRKILPGYNGSNASLFQGACSRGVEKLQDDALRKKKNFVLDGTFANQKKGEDNIKRSLSKNRRVAIFYLYQNPAIAWEFTKKREYLEHRNIQKEDFIKEFFGAKESVERVKEIFKKDIEVFIIKQGLDNRLSDVMINVDNIDSHLKINYTEEELNKLLL